MEYFEMELWKLDEDHIASLLLMDADMFRCLHQLEKDQALPLLQQRQQELLEYRKEAALFKNWVIAQLASMRTEASLGAALAPSIHKDSTRGGPPLKLYLKLFAQYEGMRDIHSRLGSEDAGELDYGKLYTGTDEWLDDYWKMLRGVRSMMQREGLRERFAFIKCNENYDGDYKEVLKDSKKKCEELRGPFLRLLEQGKANGKLTEQQVSKVSQWLNTTAEYIQEALTATEGK